MEKIAKELLPSATCPACGRKTENIEFVERLPDGTVQTWCTHKAYGIDYIRIKDYIYECTCKDCPYVLAWGTDDSDYVFTKTIVREEVECKGSEKIPSPHEGALAQKLDELDAQIKAAQENASTEDADTPKAELEQQFDAAANAFDEALKEEAAKQKAD